MTVGRPYLQIRREMGADERIKSLGCIHQTAGAALVYTQLLLGLPVVTLLVNNCGKYLQARIKSFLPRGPKKRCARQKKIYGPLPEAILGGSSVGAC